MRTLSSKLLQPPASCVVAYSTRDLRRTGTIYNGLTEENIRHDLRVDGYRFERYDASFLLESSNSSWKPSHGMREIKGDKRKMKRSMFSVYDGTSGREVCTKFRWVSQKTYFSYNFILRKNEYTFEDLVIYHYFGDEKYAKEMTDSRVHKNSKYRLFSNKRFLLRNISEISLKNILLFHVLTLSIV